MHAELDPGGLLTGSDTLYLCAPAHDQRRLTPLFVGVLRAVLDTRLRPGGTDRADRSTRRSSWCSTRRPTSPRCPDLDALAATAAGHGIQLVTVWHDLAQIQARFGPRATTVVNNHRAKLFLSGISDPATLDYASHLVGDEERHLPATTSGGRSGPSTTRSPTLRRLAPPDALRRTPTGGAVLVYRDLPPARLTLRTWFDDPWLAARGRVAPDDATESGAGADGPVASWG